MKQITVYNTFENFCSKLAEDHQTTIADVTEVAFELFERIAKENSTTLKELLEKEL